MERSLTDEVRTVCTDALRVMAPGPGRDLLARLDDRLAEPLRIAVAGSVSSGKSTLVNALLGQKVAQVATGECTRVVTWYRYDPHERVEVVLRSGAVRTLGLEGGSRVPERLGDAPEDIAHLVVRLSNDRLRRASIIDTPGLDTIDESTRAASHSFLGLPDAGGRSADATGWAEAEALIFVMQHARKGDADALDAFRASFRGAGVSAVNAVGVLTKVDQLGELGADPWAPARRIADRVAGRLGSSVAGVLPVMGLLAETANAGQLTEDDARAIRTLAGAPDAELEDALLSADIFLDSDLLDSDGTAGRIDRVHRRRLLTLLDLYGLRAAVDAVREGHRSAAALVGRLRALSGYDPLADLTTDLFARRADLLKAHAAISGLIRLSYLRDDPGNRRHLRALRDPLERLELDHRLHDLRILDVLRRVADRSLELDDDLVHDLQRLALGGTSAERVGLPASARPDEIARAAAERAGRWAACTNDPHRSPDDARWTREVKMAFELVFTSARAGRS